jgi:hypothetical protein
MCQLLQLQMGSHNHRAQGANVTACNVLLTV